MIVVTDQFFAIQHVEVGRLNALVKNIMRQTGASNAEEAVRLVNSGEWMVSKALCLEELSVIVMPAIQRFAFYPEIMGAMNVAWEGNTFPKNKVEQDVPKIKLAVHRLKEVSSCANVCRELGNRAEISLAHFVTLLRKQIRGQNGPLLVDQRLNVFFVRDANGRLWVLLAVRHAAGNRWIVDVLEPDSDQLEEMNVGCQVFSRAA